MVKEIRSGLSQPFLPLAMCEKHLLVISLCPSQPLFASNGSSALILAEGFVSGAVLSLPFFFDLREIDTKVKRNLDEIFSSFPHRIGLWYSYLTMCPAWCLACHFFLIINHLLNNR